MTYPKNAAPRAILDGWRDESAREPVRQPFQRPVHLALSLIRSGWGPETDQFVAGDQIKTLYGNDVFDRRSKFFTHSNLLAERINATGNAQLVVRLVPEDAPAPAGITVWFDVVEDEIPNYERNEDGTYKLDASGSKVVDQAQPTVVGLRYQLFATQLGTPNGETQARLGAHAKRAGNLVSDGGDTSTAYPLFELQRPHRGERGNWGGFRLIPLTTTGRDGARSDLVESTQAQLFRIQFVERPAEGKTPLVKPTLQGAQSLDVSFKAGGYDELLRRSIDIRDILLSAFNERSQDGGPDTFGVFNGMHIYEDNLQEVQELIYAVEAGNGTLGFAGGEASLDMVNWLTATSVEGVPYYNVVRDGGLLFTSSTVHYAQGGGDGTISDASFNAAAEKFMDEFETSPLRLWDPYRVPFSVFHDSGWPLDLKLKFCRLLALRDDVYVCISTQTYGQPMLNEADEYSIGQVIAQEMLSYPESVVNGTQTCRGFIFGNAGIRPALNVGRTVVPMIGYHFAEQMANFGGAADGSIDMNWLPSLPSRNVVRGYSETNAQTKNDRVIDDFWDRGIIYAQYKDRADVFVPAYQTVYEDDTSIFNSAINVVLMVEVTKVCREVWTELTGQVGLTEEQFILRSNSLIRERIGNRFGNLMQVEPDTYFSETSSQLGYPWNCRVRCSGTTMRTVGLFEVVGARLEN